MVWDVILGGFEPDEPPKRNRRATDNAPASNGSPATTATVTPPAPVVTEPAPPAPATTPSTEAPAAQA